jgi:hypothetical protein
MSHDANANKNKSAYNPLAGGSKYVKPQELSLDLIVPSNMKNGKQG